MKPKLDLHKFCFNVFQNWKMEKSTIEKVYKTMKGWNHGKYVWITITVNVKSISILPSYFIHFFSSLVNIFFPFPNSSWMSAEKE